MRLDCGRCGSAAVVRHDPDSTGFIAMCDICGWHAPKVVGKEMHFEDEPGAEQITAGEEERERNHGRRITAGQEPARRRGE